MRVALVLAGAAAVLVVAGPAAAASTEPVRLAYEAPPVCFDAEAFVKEVRARTTRFRIVDAGDDLRTFQVRLVGSGRYFVGDLRVIDRDGDVSIRSVSGADCDEVARTLAFVTAISIDPKASASPAPPEPTPPAYGASPAASSAEPAVLVPTPEPPREDAHLPALDPRITFVPEAPAAVSTPAPSPDAAGHSAVAERTRAWSLLAGVGGAIEGFAAPAAVAGESIFLALTVENASVFSPEILVAAARTSSASLTAEAGSANLQWTVARLEACPVRWPARGALDVRPCVRGEVGELSVAAIGVPGAQSHLRPWGMAGAAGRLEWSPFGPLVLDAEVSVSAPIVREHFYVAPTDVVYQAPPVAAEGGVGVGARFP